MGVRPVLDIALNDAAWNRFEEHFNRYQDALAKQPNAWKALGKEQAAIATQFERMTAAMMAQQQVTVERLKAEQDEEKQLTHTDRLWNSIAHNAKSIAGSILSTTRSLLKWGGILGGIAGGVLAGSFLGFDKLMGNLANDRRSAMGLGMGIGPMRSFELHFGRLVDPGSFLGSLQEAQTDPAKVGVLYRAGLNPNSKLEDLAPAYLDWLRKKAVETQNPMQLGLLNQQWGTSLSIDEWMRLKNTPNDEYNTIRKDYARDTSTLGISDRAALTGQNVSTQFSRAGSQTEKVFQDKLIGLAGPLAEASREMVKSAREFANSPLFSDIVKGLGTGIKWFSDALPAVTKGVEDLGDAAEDTATTLKHLAKGGTGKSRWEQLQEDLKRPGMLKLEDAFRQINNLPTTARGWFGGGSPKDKGDDSDVLRFLQREEGGMASGDSGSTPGDSTGRFSAPNTTINQNRTSYINNGRSANTRVDITVNVPPGHSVQSTVAAGAAGP